MSVCDVANPYEELKLEIDAAIAGVLSGAQYILGPNLKAFKREVCECFGCLYAICIDSLCRALRASGIGNGDEFIIAAFKFIAAIEKIHMVRANPVYVGMESEAYSIDSVLTKQVITPKAKASLPLHFFGRPCDIHAMTDIAKQHNLEISEDCAHAMVAKFNERHTGTFGEAGCLSFSKRLCEQAGKLRRHAGKFNCHDGEQRVNDRLHEFQAGDRPNYTAST